jgi:hypothetical protein
MKINSAGKMVLQLLQRPIDNLSIFDLFEGGNRKKVLFTKWFNSYLQGERVAPLEVTIQSTRAILTFEFLLAGRIVIDGLNQFQLIGHDVTMRKIHEENIKRASMRYLIEDGELYSIPVSSGIDIREIIHDMLGVGYKVNGWLRYEKEFASLVAHEKLNVNPLSRIIGNSSEVSLLEEILDKCSEVTQREVIYIDSIEFLRIEYGFEKVLRLIQDLRDLAAIKKFVIIISIDPKFYKESELEMITKETMEVFPRKQPVLRPVLREMLNFIIEMNIKGKKPDYSEISSVMGISKPTARKRIRLLIEKGILIETKTGRTKLLQVDQRFMRMT